MKTSVLVIALVVVVLAVAFHVEAAPQEKDLEAESSYLHKALHNYGKNHGFNRARETVGYFALRRGYNKHHNKLGFGGYGGGSGFGFGNGNGFGNGLGGFL